MSSNFDLSLSEDIVTEILLRLPVKSLLRFKCVCKKWQDLIQSPIFIKKHFNRETNHCRLLVQYRPPDCDLSSFALLSDENLDGTPPIHEDLYLKLQVATGDVVGPVNGLFLVHMEHGIEDSVALWNPATRDLRHLPTPEPVLPSCRVPLCHAFGFGLDCLSNDYKAIWFRYYWKEKTENHHPRIVAAIYSLRRDSWRYFDAPFPLGCMPMGGSCSTYLNGAYYWVLDVPHNCSFPIISFDMKSEVLRDIKGPETITSIPTLDVCNDCLTLFDYDYDMDADKSFIFVWAMEEDGHWTKILTIGPRFGFSVVWSWKKNQILYDNNILGRLFLYNTNTCERKDLGIQGAPNDALFNTFRYKESLVSTTRME